jgi:hypothetical protein
VKNIQCVFLLARCHVKLKCWNSKLQLVVQWRLKTILAVLLVQTVSCARASVEHFILERHLHIIEKKWLGVKSGNRGSVNKKSPCTISPFDNSVFPVT